MLGSTELFDALNVDDVTDAIDTYTDSSGEDQPALFHNIMVPPLMEVEKKTINFYRYVTVSLGQEYGKWIYSINCRAKTFYDANVIGQAVITALNRKSFGTYYIILKMLPIIPPQDERDSYNCSIEAIVKTRSGS